MTQGMENQQGIADNTLPAGADRQTAAQQHSGDQGVVAAPMTPAMKRALATAAKRERGNICPIRGVWAGAETKLIQAMDRRGYIVWDHPEGFRIGTSNVVHHGAPRISEAGRKALQEADAAGAFPMTNNRESNRVRPLTEGYVVKGGRNHGPSQIGERPATPAAMTPRRRPTRTTVYTTSLRTGFAPGYRDLIVTVTDERGNEMELRLKPEHVQSLIYGCADVAKQIGEPHPPIDWKYWPTTLHWPQVTTWMPGPRKASGATP